MRILALDPGRKCGWAVRYPDGTMRSGVWDLRVPKSEQWTSPFSRLWYFIFEKKPDLIAYEISINKYPNSMLVYLSIVETIKDTGIEFKGYHWNTIKKFATGKGNANKDAMIAAAQTKWPGPDCQCPPEERVYNDNEADARWIAEYAALQIGATT